MLKNSFLNKHDISRKRLSLLLIISIILIILSQLAKRLSLYNAELVEKYYSTGIYPVTSKIQTSIANLLPFSLYEFIIVGLVVFGLYRTIRLVHSAIKKDFIREITNFISLIIFLLSIGIFLFQFLWSLNNYRLPIKDQIGLEVHETSAAELSETYKALIHKANGIRADLNISYNTASDGSKVKNILQTAWEGYLPLAQKYSLFHSNKVKVKGLLFSRIQTISGYAGVYSFITGEPNINIEPPLVTLPHAACHEIAHQMGISLEDEANYAGFLACKNHPDILFQYSGYLSAITYVGNALYRHSPDMYNEISSLLSDEIREDQRENRSFWSKYQNDTVTKIADKANETYLKSNNQPDGMQSYGKFVDLLIADYLEDRSI